ncbi:ASF1 like histone chaperone-domain-containing protein [Blastocladiella britannica]|nr:ASF1 like histone chaperone-domain-containing protein [Blastocladiella britannica]
MSYVSITDVKISHAESPFLSNFEFEITLECLAELKEDLEFKVIYVSSATNKSKDQTLESVSVGPIPIGVNRFVLEAPPPNPATIDPSDLVGVTVVSLQVSYMNCEFVRIGYLVNNEYNDPVLQEEPPSVPDMSKLVRNILADKPRVTRFHINWENPQVIEYPDNMDEDQAMSDHDMVAEHQQALAAQAAAAQAAAATAAAAGPSGQAMEVGVS